MVTCLGLIHHLLFKTEAVELADRNKALLIHNAFKTVDKLLEVATFSSAQDNEMVPIVEPEVLMDGEHSIDECYEATERSLKSLFEHLDKKGVNIKGTLLKPNMVTSGKDASVQAGIDEVAKKTLDCLIANVPADLPGITFLSGGQSDVLATAHLDAMNKIGGFSWKLSFSYGRALQAAALQAWGGKSENVFISQDELSHRAEMNKLASLGEWEEDLEDR